MAKSPRVLTLIGSLKLAKAFALTGIATTILWRGPQLGASVRTLTEGLKVDPGNHHLSALVERISGFPARTLHAIALCTFLYAAVYATEGIGLLLRKRWAEYLTVVMTGSFLPFEIYELVERFTFVRLSALLVNVAVVAFLVWNLRRERADDAHESAPAPA